MNPIVAYLLKMVLVAGVLYTYYHVVLKDKRFHQWNRFYLLAAVFLSITLPLFHIPVYEAQETDNRLLFAVLQLLSRSKAQETILVTGPRHGLSWLTLAAYAYGIVVVCQFCLLGARLAYLRRLRRHSPLVRLEEITLVETTDKGAPFSFFHWVFWNNGVALDSPEGRHILRHELTHVRQGHSVDKIALQVVCIVFFPIIFFYLIRKELQLIHEYLADKQATANEDLVAYAQLLVSQAFQASPYVFANSFFQHPLKRRLAMMTRFSNPRFAYLRKVMFLPLVLFLFGLLSFRVEKAHPMITIRLQKAAETLQQSICCAAPIVPAKDLTLTLPSVRLSGRVSEKADTTPPHTSLPSVTVIGYASDTTHPVSSLSEVKVVEYASDTTPNPVYLTLQPAGSAERVLVVIDGKSMGKSNSLSNIDPSQIESITVLKDKTAIDKYGPDAANGVIEITTKAAAAYNSQPKDDNKIFTKVEFEAQFPGGEAAWNEYVKKTITAHMADLQKEGLSGTVEIMFIVNKDGTVTGIQSLTLANSVLAKITLDAIANGPRWIPATQNGHIVSSFRKQKITFQMPDTK